MTISMHTQEDLDFLNKPYLDSAQLGRFKEKLEARRRETARKLSRTKDRIRSLKMDNADILDQSALMQDIEQEIDFSRRYDDLLGQIDKALERIDDGTFGYCELTGEEIGLKRLEVQPWATLSIKALEEVEKANRSPHTKSYRYYN